MDRCWCRRIPSSVSCVGFASTSSCTYPKISGISCGLVISSPELLSSWTRAENVTRTLATIALPSMTIAHF